MRYVLILCILFCANISNAQQREFKMSKTPDSNGVYSFVDTMPTPGYDVLSYLSENIRYPESARKNNIQGRVILRFIVNEDGTISNVTVMRGIRGGGCDEEAARVVSAFPKWKPGKQNGKFVKVYCSQPINFKLEK